MSISNPKQLVDEFKKSGEFDRLRRELLAQFQHSVRDDAFHDPMFQIEAILQERTSAFKFRVEDIARQRLASDEKLIHLPHDSIYRELMGEIDRYPVVERAVADAPLLSDASFSAAVRASVRRILDESRGSGSKSETGGSNAASKIVQPHSVQGSLVNNNGHLTNGDVNDATATKFAG
ncbi:hypothetical protein F5I97DRAFT_1926423 [Phlebopus sp. FC_14]|nr:hypothetical protein F5I97DRAFT_1926423 [Phlebopus sp. FC_14]